VVNSDSETQEARSPWGGSQAIHFKVTNFSRQWASRPHLWRPPTDLFEKDQAYVVRVEIAGMQDAELNIALEGRLLAVYGMREHESERCAYHQMEVRFGEFLSLVELPGDILIDQISAEYADGFLHVNLPKAVD
jgi:HSP20 family molecular chaperone IbpA